MNTSMLLQTKTCYTLFSPYLSRGARGGEREGTSHCRGGLEAEAEGGGVNEKVCRTKGIQASSLCTFPFLSSLSGPAGFCLIHTGRCGCRESGGWRTKHHLSCKCMKNNSHLITLFNTDIKTSRVTFSQHMHLSFPIGSDGGGVGADGSCCPVPFLASAGWGQRQRLCLPSAHTTASNISHALGERATRSCPSLPAHIMITLSSLSFPSCTHFLRGG